MNQRVQSVDALRGITICAMILCASIGYQSDLPAWMFHCQVPPPDYVFRPEVRGITWVDLVFPFFIFAMGAAMPFSLGKKIEKGESWWRIGLSIVKRWAILVAFALVLGNADAAQGADASYWVIGFFRLAVWLALFAALVQTKKRGVNLAGWIALAALMAVQHFLLKVPLSQHHNDIIILLLSTVALVGSVLWILTRNRMWLRALVTVLLIVLKEVGWGDWSQYLIMALPATMAGDMIRNAVHNSEPMCGTGGGRLTGAAWICLAATILQLWGLFTRQVTLDLILSAVLAAAFVLLVWKQRSTVFARIGFLSFGMLLVGIVFDYIDGGIAKDYCNVCYLLATGGQSALTLCFLIWIESHRPIDRTLVMSGQNPMIAYTVGWFVICPLLSAVGLMDWFDGVCYGHPFLGFIRGAVITVLVALTARFFTSKRLFWKS